MASEAPPVCGSFAQGTTQQQHQQVMIDRKLALNVALKRGEPPPDLGLVESS